MSENLILSSGTVAAIKKKVDRVLDDLGPLEPPLNLEVVRDRLDLDLKYYSAENVSRLNKTLHKVKVAGRQILKRPTLAAEALVKVNLKALLLPDHKRILIDESLPAPKQRWGEAHEIIHDLLPWHDAVAMGDRKKTLTMGCHAQVEAEANFGAGRLLFLGERFAQELGGLAELDFQAVKDLHVTYGNSMTTTLWRVVEGCEEPRLGLISQHPRNPKPGDMVRHFVRSEYFANAFPGVTAGEVFSELRHYCFKRGGPLGQRLICLTDCAGQDHEFLLESFSNTHDVLTLGTYTGKRKAMATVA